MTELRGIVFFSLVALTSCAAIRGPDKPTTNANIAVATQYWFRGVPQSEELVGQGDVTITAPLANGDTLSAVTWGNYQLSNSTGNAAFTDGNGGDFTELDVMGTYSKEVDEVTVFGGVISYNFSNAIALSTHELMAGVTYESENKALTHTLTLYYDFDQADDFYATYGIGHTKPLDERFSLAFNGLIGYMGEGQAALYFGTEHAGFSDASVTGMLTYKYDEFTTVFAKAMGVVVPDSKLNDAEEDRDFKTSTVVFTFGVGWSF